MELRTERLLLRPFEPNDVSAFAAFAGRSEYRRHLGPGHPDPSQFVANNVAADPAREPSWVICLDGTVVGSIFLGLQPEDGLAEVACLLAPAYWGQGIALEAARAVTDYAFRHLDVAKVFARASADNSASRRAMEKAGMRHEATLRSHRIGIDGQRVDEVVYGILRDEWQPLGSGGTG